VSADSPAEKPKSERKNMKLRANKINLRKYGKDLLGNNWSADREADLVRECLSGFVHDTYHHRSFDERDHIYRIDKILGNCGCEGMVLDRKGNDVSGSCCESLVAHDIQYSNTGDTYGVTIFYHNHKLYIGDWGSIVERLS
jgi:hypothetical protein